MNDRLLAVELPAESSDRPKSASLSLQALRIFCAVVEHGSFSKAALALGVSQPTISFQIANLEAVCEARLLHRKPNLRLTDVGQVFHGRLKVILRRFDDLFQELDAFRDLGRGRLSVGFSAPRCAMRLLGEFSRLYPAISFETVSGNTRKLLNEVEQGRVDLAIVGLTSPPAQLSSYLIEPLTLTLWADAGHKLAARPQVNLRDIVELPLIGREAGSMTRALFERACEDQGLCPTYRLEVEGREGVREAVAAGLGAGVVFSAEAGRDDRLACIPITDVRRHAGLYLVHLPEMAEMMTVAAMVRLVQMR